MKDTVLMLVESMKQVKGTDTCGEKNYIYNYLKSCIYDYYVTSEECVYDICMRIVSMHFEETDIDVVAELEKISELNNKLINNLEKSKTLYNYIEKYMIKCFEKMYSVFSTHTKEEIDVVLGKYTTLVDFIGRKIEYD